MDPVFQRLGDVTIQRLEKPKDKVGLQSNRDFVEKEGKEEKPSEDVNIEEIQGIKRNFDDVPGPSTNKKTKFDKCDIKRLNDETSGNSFSENELSDYETESELESDENLPNFSLKSQNSNLESATSELETSTDFFEKLVQEPFDEDEMKPVNEIKTEIDDYDYDIKEKLKEMGEISFETVKKGEKPKKPETYMENEVVVTPAKKPGSLDDDIAERKIGNLRRNIREVMDETKLDESTLAAQRQEMERLRRVQEQQRLIREVQRQMAQDRVISLLQGNVPKPGTSGGRIGSTVLVKLPNGQTKTMTKLSKRPFELVRVPKSAVPPHKSAKSLIAIKKPTGNLTPSVSIAPVMKKPPPFTRPMSDTDSDNEDSLLRKPIARPKPKDPVPTIDISSDDDCIVVSESENDPNNEEGDDPSNSGMHTNDEFNQPDEQGRVVVNIGHPEGEPDLYIAPQIARIIKPHQIGGVRFLFDNVIESVNRFETSTGFGCILAHSMGLGKTLQVICFSDIFLRHTPARTILCIMPINTLQNWLAEYNMWLPTENSASNSPLNAHGEVRPRNFNLHVLNDSHKTLAARAKVIHEWKTGGGVLLIGYEQYRLLSQRKHPKSRRKPVPQEPLDDDKNKILFDEVHEALVKPGPDLVICDEGHRIKNSHASISQALKLMRTKRRVVLTGYPLQNNLMEYWCMVDFVRPNYLGTKTEFCNMFERPIQNGQCIDSTESDIKLMRYRAHVLHSLLVGFVQRRSHTVLQTALPQKEEYVLLVRMTDFQRKLYETFMNEVVRTQTVPNPLKAFAVCCKIWNHPDVLYYFLKKQAGGEAVDIDLEEVSNSTVSSNDTSKSRRSARKSAPKGKTVGKPAASITPYNSSSDPSNKSSARNRNLTVNKSTNQNILNPPITQNSSPLSASSQGNSNFNQNQNSTNLPPSQQAINYSQNSQGGYQNANYANSTSPAVFNENSQTGSIGRANTPQDIYSQNSQGSGNFPPSSQFNVSSNNQPSNFTSSNQIGFSQNNQTEGFSQAAKSSNPTANVSQATNFENYSSNPNLQQNQAGFLPKQSANPPPQNLMAENFASNNQPESFPPNNQSNSFSGNSSETYHNFPNNFSQNSTPCKFSQSTFQASSPSSNFSRNNQSSNFPQANQPPSSPAQNSQFSNYSQNNKSGSFNLNSQPPAFNGSGNFPPTNNQSSNFSTPNHQSSQPNNYQGTNFIPNTSQTQNSQTSNFTSNNQPQNNFPVNSQNDNFPAGNSSNKMTPPATNYQTSNYAQGSQPNNYAQTNFSTGQSSNFSQNSPSINFPPNTQPGSYSPNSQSSNLHVTNQQSNFSTNSPANFPQNNQSNFTANSSSNPNPQFQQSNNFQSYQQNYWSQDPNFKQPNESYNNFRPPYNQNFNIQQNQQWIKKEDVKPIISNNIITNPVKSESGTSDTKPKINIISDIKLSSGFDMKKINILSDIKLEPKIELDEIKEEKPDVKDFKTEQKHETKLDPSDEDIKVPDPSSALKVVSKEDTGIPYDWAYELLKDYIPGCIENSGKMEILFCIIRESIALGDRLLVFSQSLITLDLIEQFLQTNVVPGETHNWAKNVNYYRLDGSTSALEREKLINEFNSNPKIYLFLVSTRAGSLGINLIGANRVVVLDASWNPCHDTQAVCRVYRYGQRKPCFVYRLVVDNCLEKKIYDRQINKQGMSDRVVDECNPDAHLTMKDVSTLCWDDGEEGEAKDWANYKDNYIDVVLQKVLVQYGTRLNKEPFQHESLLVDRKDKQLSQQEKRLAKKGYEREKQASRQPAYNIASASRGHRPVASVRPMQQGGDRPTRWIPAEHWQRQGMTAQEMTLPLDVVIPTNQPDKGNIVLKAGQKVLVLKSPKGVYMQLESGKIVSIKTAIKVRGKAEEDAAKVKPALPLGIKNNAAISVLPQKRAVKPFTPGLTKLNMRSIKQAVPNLVSRIQNVTKKVQMAKTKPYQIGQEIARAINQGRIETESHPSSSDEERMQVEKRHFNFSKDSGLTIEPRTKGSHSDDSRSNTSERMPLEIEPHNSKSKPYRQSGFAKSNAKTSALEQLEQSTSAIMSESKQPFQETLDSITSTYPEEEKLSDTSSHASTTHSANQSSQSISSTSDQEVIPVEDQHYQHDNELSASSVPSVEPMKSEISSPDYSYNSYYGYNHMQPYPPPPQGYPGYPPQPPPYDMIGYPPQQPQYNYGMYPPQNYPPQPQYPPQGPYDYGQPPPQPSMYGGYHSYPPQQYPPPPPPQGIYPPPPGPPVPSYPDYQYNPGPHPHGSAPPPPQPAAPYYPGH